MKQADTIKDFNLKISQFSHWNLLNKRGWRETVLESYFQIF